MLNNHSFFEALRGLFSGSAKKQSQPVKPKLSEVLPAMQDPRLRKILLSDGIKIIDAQRVVSDVDTVERIVYLDYNYNKEQLAIFSGNIYDHFKPYPDLPFELQELLGEGAPNPYPDMNGAYISIYKFRGKYITSDEISSVKIITADGILRASHGNLSFELLTRAERNADVVTYYRKRLGRNADRTGWVLLEEKIEIKGTGDELGSQVWRTDFGGGKFGCELRAPLKNAVSIAAMVKTNSDGGAMQLDPDLDDIDYETLFNGTKPV